MLPYRAAIRLGLLPIAFTATSSRAGEPYIYGGAYGGGRGPLWSSPGFYGPGPAWGANRNPYYGAGWSYYGLGGGPFINYPFFWNVPPAATPSFWSNGLTLYGPPVPTYGPTPGSFGGSDAGKLFFRNPPPANGVFVGLGWGGYRTPSPRPSHPSVSVYPQAAPLPFSAPLPAASDPSCIRLAVRLPNADAIVWVDKTETKLKGVERVYDSPPLKAGEKYKYELVAMWTDNGQSKAESRSVSANAGETVLVDFTIPDTSVAPASAR